jgi:hypothetical protein
MNHSITTGTARFTVTEVSGVITAIDAEGVPNAEVVQRYTIGKRYAAWRARMAQKNRVTCGVRR